MDAATLISRLRTVLREIKDRRHDENVVIGLLQKQGYNYEANARLDKCTAADKVMYEIETVVDIAERENKAAAVWKY